MTRREALDYVKLCARDSERAHRSDMDFRAADPRRLGEACRIVVSMSSAPAYAKKFAYSQLGGNYEDGYLPNDCKAGA